MTLLAHGRPVAGAFDLLGQDENAMTAALGLALERSAELRALILRDIGCSDELARTDAIIRLQSCGGPPEARPFLPPGHDPAPSATSSDGPAHRRQLLATSRG